MKTRPSIRERSVRASDEGVALITVIGVLALVTILVIAGFALAQQSLHEANLVNTESQAFQAANAGLDAAVARIQYQGFRTTDFPLVIPSAAIGSGATTVTVTEINKNEYKLVSSGMGPNSTFETVTVRLYFIDLYGMNVSYGAKLNSGPSAGKINGTTSIYGPLYTWGDLDNSNLPGGSGCISWGPLMVKKGSVNDPGGTADVGTIYYDAGKTVISGATPPPRLINSVPDFVVPPVDTAYLTAALARAQSESSDNNQGEPALRPGVVNTEATTKGNPATYAVGRPANQQRASGATSYYKVIDTNSIIDRSATSGLSLSSSTPAFGMATDDFAWDPSTMTLTVWGTVFIDGPLSTNGAINYVGNGIIVANGPITLYGGMVPLHGLLPGLGGKTEATMQTYANQSFSGEECLGFVSPDKIVIDSGGGNSKGPDTVPSHAGAFYCMNTNGNDPNLGSILIGTKAVMVGSVIARGIDFIGNNNQHLRTSANLGQTVSKQMPGYGQMVQSFGTWARK